MIQAFFVGLIILGVLCGMYDVAHWLLFGTTAGPQKAHEPIEIKEWTNVPDEPEYRPDYDQAHYDKDKEIDLFFIGLKEKQIQNLLKSVPKFHAEDAPIRVTPKDGKSWLEEVLKG